MRFDHEPLKLCSIWRCQDGLIITQHHSRRAFHTDWIYGTF